MCHQLTNQALYAIGPKAFVHTSAKLAWVGTQIVLTILALMDDRIPVKKNLV